MEDVVRDLNRLAQYAAGLQELFTEFQDAAPEQSVGTDRSGVVQAVLGRDGLPQVVRVHPNWKERLRPGSFAAAVTEACGAAMQERGKVWQQSLERSGWQQRADRLDQDQARGPGIAPGTVPPAFRRPGPARGHPQPLEYLADEAMGLLGDAGRRAARASALPQRAVGTNRGGQLSVTLTPAGQVTCEANAEWVAERSGETLTEELRQALAFARQELASADAADGSQAELAGRGERLMADILATFQEEQNSFSY